MAVAHRRSSARFRDRADAGAQLARRLLARGAGSAGDSIVVGLPRGGLPVAATVAAALGAPLDVVVVRKLGVPWQPEVAFGAVGEGGVRVLNPAVVRQVPVEQVERVTAREVAELERRVRAWRGGRSPHDLSGRTVVVVDDGIATGATARAALQVLRARGVGRLVLAVPVVAADSAQELRPLVDDLVAVHEPTDLRAVGAWYDDFAQVDDTVVRDLLSAGRTD